jgi:hypothetical protein
MAIAYNPQIVPHGLVFLFDAANRKCISPLGCTGFNTAPQLVRNLMSPSDVINSYNGVKLGNLSYYTVFAIDYPEGSYGGDAAGRHGITPGYNVRSGSKTIEFGRALTHAVYNNPTQSWVKGTVYDTYAYTSEVDRFVSEYATAVAAYPDAVHIVAGSHRDSNHNTAQYNILRDLGAPSNVDSIIGFSSPEWILVGKPGLGAGNAYGWAFQNYSTNPDQVAHLNFGLPIYGGTGNYLEFDGTDDYISAPNTSLIHRTSNWAYSAWVNFSGTPSLGTIFENGSWTSCLLIRFETNGITIHSMSSYWGKFSFSPTIGTWYKLDFIRNGNVIDFYLNGLYSQSISFTADIQPSPNLFIGMSQHAAGQCFHGKMAYIQIYNRALSAAEIQQNFNALRGRFSI